MATKRKAAEVAQSISPEKKARSITSFFGQPKRVHTAVQEKPKNFDKETWVKSLTPEQRELLKLEINTLDTTWLAELQDTVLAPSFMNLKRFLQKEKAAGTTIYPKEEDIYSWSRHTPLNTVKVVILGQDPYHNVNQAHGLSFSVLPPTRAPPSLANMYQALKKDFPTFTPPPNNGGNLMPWADRGVLLLNASLTVKAHTANSHQNQGWEPFTQKVIDVVAQKCTRGVVFMAWGSNAAKRVGKVDKSRHLVLHSVHPSPLSAHKGPVTFFDAHHFKKANEWLTTRYDDDGGIDWNAVNPRGVSLLKSKEAETSPPAVSKPTIEDKENIVKTAVEDDFDDDEAALREAEAELDAVEPTIDTVKEAKAVPAHSSDYVIKAAKTSELAGSNAASETGETRNNAHPISKEQNNESEQQGDLGAQEDKKTETGAEKAEEVQE